jgi:hypothetical protein
MATIRELATGRTVTLEWDCIVGRAGPPMCAVTLDGAHVSGIHASLRWVGTNWELKDLGSRNGTFLDGRRLETGVAQALRSGTKVGFGGIDREWELLDTGAPQVMVVPLDGGPPLEVASDLVALPSPEDPRAMLYRSAAGRWVLERADQPPVDVPQGNVFEVAGRLWRLSCPTAAPTLASVGSTRRVKPVAAQVRLTFGVSRDEEHVHVRAVVAGAEIDLGDSVYFYLLLTLARRRVKDAEQGLPETSCGWIDQEDLSHDPMMAGAHLNLAIFRIRLIFERLGIMDSALMVERRANPRQLRIGTQLLRIETI